MSAASKRPFHGVMWGAGVHFLSILRPMPKSRNFVQEAQTFSHESSGNLVFSSQPGEEVGLLGVENLVVVRSAGQTLVAHKDKVEDLKEYWPKEIIRESCDTHRHTSQDYRVTGRNDFSLGPLCCNIAPGSFPAW